MNREREKLLERIRKCLRLSKSSNEHEAAAAMRQAQKLMAELGVSESDVHAAEARARAFSSQKPSVWETALAHMVGEALGCQIIFSSGLPRWAKVPGVSIHGEWCFVGCNSAETIARYAFVALLRQLRFARAHYIEKHLGRCGPSSKRRRADHYCEGWVWAVRSKVEPLAISEQDQAHIKAMVEKRSICTLTPRSGGASRANEMDTARGFRDGKTVDLRAPVSGHAQEALR